MANYSVQWRGRAVGPLGGVRHFDPEWIPSVYKGVVPRDAVVRELQAYDHQAKGPVWYAVNDPNVPVEPALLVWRVDGNGVRLADEPIMQVLLTHEWREHVAGIPPEDRQWGPSAGRNPLPGVHIATGPTTVVAAPPLATPPQAQSPPAKPQPTLPTKPAPPPPVLVDKSVGISRKPTPPVSPVPKPPAPVVQERQPLQGARLVGIRERVNAALQRADELGMRSLQRAGSGAAGLGKNAQQVGRVVVRRKQQMGKQKQQGRKGF